MKAKKIDLYDHNRTELHKAIPLNTPYAVNIEPTSFCNIRCNYCIHALSKKDLDAVNFDLGYMNNDTFEMIIKQLKEFPQKIKSVTFGGIGEPLLHNKLPEMIRIVKEKNITDRINLITNGIILNNDLTLELINAGLSNIKISVQGMTSNDYKKICGTEIDYQRFVENIKFLYNNKNNCTIGIKIADISLNENDEELFYNTYGDICDLINIEHIVPCFQEVKYDKIIEFRKFSSRYEIEKKSINICPLLFYRLNVFHDGRVSLCTTLGLTKSNMNIYNRSLVEIWNSDDRKQMIIKNLLGKRKEMDVCVNCNLIYDFAYKEDNVDKYAIDLLKHFI